MTERQTAPRGEPAATSPADDPHAEPHPTGTLVLMLLFILLIVVLWGVTYLTLLGRGQPALERWGLQITLTVALVVLAYGPHLLAYAPSFASPGFRGIW